LPLQSPDPNALRAPNRSASQFHTVLQYVALSKDAFPTSRRASPAASNHFACQNKHRFLVSDSEVRIIVRRQIRLSFALRSEAAQLSEAIALKGTCVLEPFTRGGLSF
jgi:hypothetical protein